MLWPAAVFRRGTTQISFRGFAPAHPNFAPNFVKICAKSRFCHFSFLVHVRPSGSWGSMRRRICLIAYYPIWNRAWIWAARRPDGLLRGSVQLAPRKKPKPGRPPRSARILTSSYCSDETGVADTSPNSSLIENWQELAAVTDHNSKPGCGKVQMLGVSK